MNEIGRRDALGLFFGAGAALALSACSSDTSTDGTERATTPSSSASELEDTTGDLTLSLWAEPTTAEITPGVTTDVYSFGAEVIDGDPASVTPSGSYLGPTLHLRTGQRVRITFENRLPDESIVHWHGLVVPQDQDGQPSDAVAPGATYDYDFVIDNPPGTYWYHPHPHGRTGEQVYKGLAGLLIIHGDEPPLPLGDNDLPVVLQDRTFGSDGQLRYVTNMHDQMAGFVGDTLVTNGVANLTVEVRREAYRIRILNGANSRTQHLTWSTGQPLTAIATDGNLLREPTDVDGLVLTPAQRTDLWVDFSTLEPGQQLELLSSDTFIESGSMMGNGMGSPAGSDLDLDPSVAVTFIVIDSEPSPGSLPDALGTAPSFGASDAINAGSPKEIILSTRRASHWINDRQWEGRDATDLETVTANTVELWEFVNQSPMAHPMHLHGRSFLVTGRSWDDDSAAGSWATIESGVIDAGLRDTVLVWPGQRVQIAVPFADHRGYFLYHCHILEHEDSGMMRNFLVT